MINVKNAIYFWKIACVAIFVMKTQENATAVIIARQLEMLAHVVRIAVNQRRKDATAVHIADLMKNATAV